MILEPNGQMRTRDMNLMPQFRRNRFYEMSFDDDFQIAVLGLQSEALTGDLHNLREQVHENLRLRWQQRQINGLKQIQINSHKTW